VIHYENGFTLVDLSRGGGSLSSKPTIIWSHPFEKLRMSADDGSRLAWLDFGEDGEQVRDGSTADYCRLVGHLAVIV